jgi:hypothetical protein
MLASRVVYFRQGARSVAAANRRTRIGESQSRGERTDLRMRSYYEVGSYLPMENFTIGRKGPDRLWVMEETSMPHGTDFPDREIVEN